ncbi:hypothetical protein [Aneurinibacillus aneurinilyticus]
MLCIKILKPTLFEFTYYIMQINKELLQKEFSPKLTVTDIR